MTVPRRLRLGADIVVYGEPADGQLTYDGDGLRVKRTMLNVTTAYVSAHYEKNLNTGVVTKYYYFGGKRVAMRVASTPYYLFPDHLGSTRVTADASGNRVAELWYWPYGNTRLTWGSTPTDRRYTGQVFDANAGLYYYGARYYDMQIGRFISPDPIVPEPGNPQALNRYSYVYNNPLRYIDPTGNQPEWLIRAIRQAQTSIYRWTGPGSSLYNSSLTVCGSIGCASVSIRDINNRLGDRAIKGLNDEIQQAAQDAGVPTFLLAAALHHQGGSPDLRDKIVLALGLESEERLSRGIGQITIEEAQYYNKERLVLDPVPDETLREDLYIREVSVRYMAAKLKESSRLIDTYLDDPRYSTISLSEPMRWLLLMPAQNIGTASVIRFFDVCRGDWSCWFADWSISSQVLNMVDDILWLQEQGGTNDL